MSEQREILTWETYGVGARELAGMVVDSGYRPDVILSIARGGLFIAGSLGYALSTKNIFVMNVEYYTDIEERHEVPIVLPPYLELVDLDGARMLIADDVADTGHTLEMVRDFCTAKVGEVRTAVLYEKPISVVKCDYIWRRTDLWIDFPWSCEPPLIGGGTAH
ncbi:MAG: phosphoribosyltransferase [Acidimicrobiia bacterium]|nr:phosphoribosyltransferase [Acidimicrobiia bacterium]MYC45211.1 phosphoribosyltransferase [Acidimicrobiia bacterium]